MNSRSELKKKTCYISGLLYSPQHFPLPWEALNETQTWKPCRNCILFSWPFCEDFQTFKRAERTLRENPSPWFYREHISVLNHVSVHPSLPFSYLCAIWFLRHLKVDYSHQWNCKLSYEKDAINGVKTDWEKACSTDITQAKSRNLEKAKKKRWSCLKKKSIKHRNN